MRLLVFGGRRFTDRKAIYNGIAEALEWVSTDVITTWMPPDGTVIIHGDCPTGVDSIVDDWAIVHWTRVERYPAEWEKYGKAAGPIRNQRMIDEGKPDKGLGFPGGAGTADMARRLRKAGIPLIEWGLHP